LTTSNVDVGQRAARLAWRSRRAVRARDLLAALITRLEIDVKISSWLES
jgi:hypothetical protein